MTAMTSQDIINQFANELAGVISALSEMPAVAEPADTAPGAGYLVAIAAAERGRGSLWVQFDAEGIGQFASRAAGSTDVLPQPALIEAIEHLCSQVATSIVAGQKLSGVRLVVQSVEAVASAPAAVSPVLLRILREGAAPVSVAVWGTLELSATDAPAISTLRLDVILDMELPLIVRFGRTQMLLKTLTELAPGAVIDLGRMPDEPVEVLVSNQIVARGEVVVVGGSYGVRITDIISPADRVRCMEAIA